MYDARNKERVSYVERPADAPLAERFRPHLLWHTSGADGGAEPTTELLIGWADSVKIGRLRAREGIGPATVDRTRYYLEVVSIIQTDCYVAGLAVASVWLCAAVVFAPRFTATAAARAPGLAHMAHSAAITYPAPLRAVAAAVHGGAALLCGAG